MVDMSRAPTSPPPPSSPLATSWAKDLLHPLPLAAVAVLALNDHALKGAGVLPGWVTGKLSDVAGLFFFPLLLSAIARGAARLALRRDIENTKALAGVAGLLTGAVFTAVKLYPPFNAWIASVWGVMVMDATDLFTLPMIPLAAAFMLRARSDAKAPAEAAARRAGSPAALPAPARRFVDFAAVLAAGLASAATSKAPTPPPAVPPQPVAVVAEPALPTSNTPCASLELAVCERSLSGTYVVAKATGAGPGSCAIDVSEAVELVEGDGAVHVEMLPARVKVKESESTTFSMSFLRPVDHGRVTQDVVLRLEVRGARADGDAISQSVDLSLPCTQR
jgi:hypothetical protein